MPMPESATSNPALEMEARPVEPEADHAVAGPTGRKRPLWVGLISGTIVAVLITPFVIMLMALMGLVVYGPPGVWGAVNLTPYVAAVALIGVWSRVVRDWSAGRVAR